MRETCNSSICVICSSFFPRWTGCSMICRWRAHCTPLGTGLVTAYLFIHYSQVNKHKADSESGVLRGVTQLSGSLCCLLKLLQGVTWRHTPVLAFFSLCLPSSLYCACPLSAILCTCPAFRSPYSLFWVLLSCPLRDIHKVAK
jgi:hypothetical protein